jgi:hypothetical protein
MVSVSFKMPRPPQAEVDAEAVNGEGSQFETPFLPPFPWLHS